MVAWFGKRAHPDNPAQSNTLGSAEPGNRRVSARSNTGIDSELKSICRLEEFRGCVFIAAPARDGVPRFGGGIHFCQDSKDLGSTWHSTDAGGRAGLAADLDRQARPTEHLSFSHAL